MKRKKGETRDAQMGGEQRMKEKGSENRGEVIGKRWGMRVNTAEEGVKETRERRKSCEDAKSH